MRWAYGEVNVGKKAVVITISSKGIVFCSEDRKVKAVRSKPRDIIWGSAVRNIG